MFGRKKETTRERNHYENKWWELQYQDSDSYRKMEKLFKEIKNSQDAMECFPIGSVDRESENAHLTSLRHSMLCACGEYDSIRAELKRLYIDHHHEMENRYCLNGLYEPKGNCHEALRRIAEMFRKYP